MKELIKRAMHDGQIIEIVYQAKDGSISQRHIRVLSMRGDRLFAYCFLRGKKRLFQLDQLLAAYPATIQHRSIG